MYSGSIFDWEDMIKESNRHREDTAISTYRVTYQGVSNIVKVDSKLTYEQAREYIINSLGYHQLSKIEKL